MGALPYRDTPSGSAEVLLITSRDTKRWVVPKGNMIRGLAPHAAAAVEAWEEAGLRGLVCPSPLGSFRYDKRRRLGGTRTHDVALFPLMVLEESSDWPERHERVTQWFDLTAAAAAVDEPGLKLLIAGFRPPPAYAFGSRLLPAMRTEMGRRVPMLGWFQSLMPKQGRFFEQFEAHAGTLVAGADALARLLGGVGDPGEAVTHIVHREHEADAITRDVLQDVRRVFVTPFDRSAIVNLIGSMDDAIDQMNSFATSITLYEVTEFAPQMRDMGGIIVEAARVTAEAVPLLRSLSANGHRINELTARLIEIEGHADQIHDEGIKALFRQASDGETMRFIVGRELYSSLERIVDRFEDVANEIQGLVIDHA